MQRVIDHAIVPEHPSALWPYVVAILAHRGRPLLGQLHPPLRDRPRRRAARGPPAGAALRRLPALPAGVLRPAPDRPGRLPCDERPLPDPLLHRLGRRPGLPERHDDHRRRDHAGAREPAADAVLGRRHTADRVRRLALRPPRDADLAQRAGGARATSPRPPTRRSSASRWCRRSGARTTCASASAARRRAVRDMVVRQAGVEATHLPALFFLPSLSIAAVVFFGGRDVINGDLTIGQFVLFNTILLQLTWPLEALGWILNLAQRAIASAGRTFAWLEEVRVPARGRRAAPRCPPDGLAVRFEDVHFAYPGEEEVLDGVDLDARRGRDRGRLRRDRRGQEHAPEPAAARSTTRPPAGVLRRRRRPARRRARRPARRRRRDHPAADPVLDHAAREPHRRPPRRALGRGRGDVPGRRRQRLRARPAARLRHADRRARREPLRRPAPARRARPRPDRGHTRDRARRPALGGRHAHRARPGRRGCGRRSRAAPCCVATQRLSTLALADRAVVLAGRPDRRGRPPGDLLAAGGHVRRAVRRGAIGVANRTGLSRLGRYLRGPLAARRAA